NPTFAELDESDMDVVVAGTADSIIMVEGGSREVSEADLLQALEFAMDQIRRQVEAQAELVGRVAKTKRPPLPPPDTSALRGELEGRYRDALKRAIRISGKEARQEEVDRITAEGQAAFQDNFPEQAALIPKLLHDLEREELRHMVLLEGVRADGRR